MTSNIIDKEYYESSDYFNKNAQYFLNTQTRFQKYRLKKVLEIYGPSRSDKVLDLGCAWGTFTFMLAPLCRDVIGLDFSQKIIEICQAKQKELGLKNVSFICADARQTNLEPELFDVVICADFFEHLYPADSLAVMREAHRVLKKGGKFVIWTPFRGHLLEILRNHNIIFKKAPSHVNYKTMPGLITDLKNNSFEIIKSYYAESHLSIFNYLEKLLIPILPIFRRRIAILAQKK